MKLIKKFLLVIVTICFVAVLFGCSKKANYSSEFTVPEGGYDGSEVTITFYSTMGKNLTPTLDTAIEEFNKLYPNIKVNHQSIGGYDDVRSSISKELVAGNHPNLAYCYPDHVAMYNLSHAVVTLDNLINSKETVTHADGTTETLGLTQEQIDDFIEGYYEEGKQFGDGLMYTLPFSKSTEVLYYNKTFFEEHELTVPTTWEELETLCAKIKKIDPNCYPLGYDSESNWFITMCEQYGYPYTSANAPHFLFNTPQHHAFVKWFRSWYQKGYVTTQAIYKSYTSALFTEIKPDKVKSYMTIGSSAGATHQRPAKDADGNYPFEVGIATIPQVNPDKPKVISQGPSICIFSKTNPQEIVASWLLVKYLTTSVNFQAEFSLVSGYVPVIKSVEKNKVYASQLKNANGYDNISSLSAKICLAQQAAYYTSPAFNGSSIARTQVGYIIQNCLTNKWDENEVDAMIAKEFENAISECEYFA